MLKRETAYLNAMSGQNSLMEISNCNALFVNNSLEKTKFCVFSTLFGHFLSEKFNHFKNIAHGNIFEDNSPV